MSKVIIIANGKIENKQFYQQLLQQAEVIICADGGANHTRDLGIVPNYVIGDMDSINNNLLKELQQNKQCKIIIDPNQDKTDLELAIELAESLHPQEIIIIGGIGERLDHTLANIISFSKIPAQINTCFLNEKNKVWIANGKKEGVILKILQGENQGTKITLLN